MTPRNRIALFVGLVCLTAIAVFVVDRLIERQSVASTQHGGGVQAVTVNIDSGKVKLVPIAEGFVTSKITSTYVARKPEVNSTVDPNYTLQIDQKCPGINIGKCESNMEIGLPPNVKATINTNGAVDASGVRGETVVRGKGGSVELTEMFGRVDVETTKGSIDIDKSSSLDVRAVSKSGKVSFKATAEPQNVDAETASGKIELQVPKKETYKVDASSASGKLVIDLQNDVGAPRELRAKSDSGDVTVKNS